MLLSVYAWPSDTTMPDTATPDNEGGLGQQKVTLCHKGKNEITVGEPAADAHLNHGDTEGACQAGNIDGTENRDEISDGADDEVMNSTRGGEDLYGDSAADNLRGSPNADFLQGGRGPDRMFGGTNKDYIDGVDSIAGNDKVYGGWGTDHCVGDDGDTFEGCDGNVVEVSVPSDASAQTEGGR